MALRGKEETFVRRFAAGGNDGVPFNPRGYGDHSRRFAARGNEIVDHENFRESCDGYHPRRFAARGNEDHDLLYDSSPIFDEYEDDVWYAWATGGSYRCGFDEAVRLNENSLSPKIAGMFAKKIYVYVAVYSLVTGGDRNLPGDYHAFSQDDRKLPLVSSKGLSIFYHIALSPTLVATPLSQQRYGGLESNLESNSRDLEYSNILGCDLKSQIQNKEKIIVAINVGISVDIFKDKNMKVNKRRSSAPFDPGGTSPELDETPREVEQFRRVVIIAQKIGVDVPFDPGDFGPKTKLEDEFFRRRGV